MPPRDSPDPLSSMWAWIAYDLRFYRMRARMNGEDFGKIMGVVRSTVSRMESGEYKVNEDHARNLDTHFNTGGHFQRLVWYARLGHDPDWFKEHVSYEARASVLKIFELALIPGLLQTEAYARACFEEAGIEDLEEQIAARMARQESLNRSPRPMLMVLLSESVITWPVGGRSVMREQLAHLLNVGSQRNVSLRVVPSSTGAYIGLDGAFKVLSVREGDVAYTEAHGGGRLILSAPEVRSYGLRYDRIGAKALPEDSSRSLIEQVMEAMR